MRRPPTATTTKPSSDNDDSNRRNTTLFPPLNGGGGGGQEERKKQFLHRSFSMPTIETYPGNSDFGQHLMQQPRMITPGPPIKAPIEQPLSVQFRDTGSFLKHLDGVLGDDVVPSNSSVQSLSVSSLSLSTSDHHVDNNNNNTKQPVMAGKTLGNSVKIGTKKKQRKAKTRDKGEWPFVDGSGGYE